MPRIRADARDRALAGVERECVEATLGKPVPLLDQRLELCGLRAQALRLWLLPACIEEFGHRQAGGVEVPLELDGRQRYLDKLPVLIDDCVAGVLPALVVVAVPTAGRVFLKSVAVAIPEFVAPSQCGAGC